MINLDREHSIAILIRFADTKDFGVLVEDETGAHVHDLHGQRLDDDLNYQDATSEETPPAVLRDFRARWSTDTALAAIQPKIHLILPCPFCGSPAITYATKRGGMFGVQCSSTNCDVTTLGPHGYTVAEAVEKWNRRWNAAEGQHVKVTRIG